MIKRHLFLLLVLSGFDLFAGSGRIAFEERGLAEPDSLVFGIYPDTIPFRLTKANNISIQAIVNQVDTVELMFHTASNSVTLIEAATEKTTSLHFEENAEESESWGGGGTTRYAKDNKLQIGNSQWAGLLIWEDKHSGPGTDGKFGPNLFDNNFIEIDFDHSRMIVHSSLPTIDKEYNKYRLVDDGGLLFLEAICKFGKEEVANRFLVHSGYSGAVLFDDGFVERENLNQQLEVISESQLKDSFGNVLKTKNAILPSFFIGGATLNDVPATFFQGSIGRQKMSVIGGNILKRFNMVIDVGNDIIYLKPNSLLELPFSN